MNEQIEQLERQLAEMAPSKRWGIYAVLFLCALYMSWTLYGESLFEENEITQEQIISLQNKLMKNSSRSLESAIKKTQKEILALEDRINHLHFQQQFVETKLQSIDFIFYSSKGAAEILDEVLRYSVNHALTIDTIQKRQLDPHGENMLQAQSALQVSGAGSLGNITKLMHHVESLNALLVIDSLHVSIDETNATHFKMDLLHYGVEL